MSSTQYAVEVSNISSSTTDENLHAFFAFCGSIHSISHKGETATVYFESANAVRTASLLNGARLDGNELHIKGEEHADQEESEHHAGGTPFVQSDKPRAGIAAEYLAKGYELSDTILQRAIAFDSEKGVSKRFLSYWQTVDTTVGQKTLGPDKTVSGKVTETLSYATDRAKTLDEQKGVSKTAFDYYNWALSTPLGQKVREFYTTSNKQVRDIHEEAVRIKESHKSNGSNQPSAAEQHGAALNNAAGQEGAPASVGAPVDTTTSAPLV